MKGYTVEIPDELRKAIYMQAAVELDATAADVARRWLEIGRQVETGAGIEPLRNTLVALAAEKITAGEAYQEISVMIQRVCLENRAALEAEWSGYNDRDTC